MYVSGRGEVQMQNGQSDEARSAAAAVSWDEQTDNDSSVLRLSGVHTFQKSSKERLACGLRLHKLASARTVWANAGQE